VKRTDPRVKRLRAVEDLKEQTLIEAEIDRFRMRSSQYVDNDGQQGALDKLLLQLCKYYLIFSQNGEGREKQDQKEMLIIRSDGDLASSKKQKIALFWVK